jgi:uncharacterized delta-60 repeat protein
LDTTFADPNVNADVTTLTVQSDGKIVIGGYFTSVGGQARSGVARLNSDGTLDTTFVDPNVSSTVWSIILQSDGKILIGGFFTSVGGQTRNRVARLNSDGTLDTTFDPNASGEVMTLALQSDGKILIGGFFTSVGGVPRNRAARLVEQVGEVSGPVDPSAYLIKDRSISYDEIIEIAGGVALTENQILFIEQVGGENIIIQAYGVES